MFDIFVIFTILVLFVALVFTFVAKKRMDNNEPVFGWRRKQFLEEQRESEGGAVSQPEENGKSILKLKGRKKGEVQDPNVESIKDLLEVNDIEYGIIHKQKNEYSIILSSDFVNFDLLKPSEQLGILQGYQQLYNVINFPIQILGQAVRQDFRKERIRFEENLKKCNPQTRKYNMDVIEHIQSRTMDDFRISLRIYYVVNYIYEPSKMAKLNKEQREKVIIEQLYMRANIVRRALRRAKIEAEIQDSLRAMEVLKRAMNRDRTVLHPIEDLAEKEKMAAFVTMDPSAVAGFVDLVHEHEEALEVVQTEEESEKARDAVTS
ncbi:MULTISPECIES: hypothetical protein [unclassified Sporosarcina]|uniref:hypothetical protein n=1 Tax=unclassified Sporosarcina TaxID=2647733 RepID=UPI001A916FB4|nr:MULTISPECIES: hypothetical protein [unclassified Sporosarcina]MBO0588396.1 hypothetical protein [Sporosarcina sp. E16_8]MBO0601906.1 hypothetical protein [Sporosarcina sp. E16_3]